jgi:hypothetical protein
MLILIQTKNNQNKNENIITLPYWLNGTNNKNIKKIYIVRNMILKQ